MQNKVEVILSAVSLGLWSVFLPILAGLLCLVLGKANKNLRNWFAVIAALVTFIFSLMLIQHLAKGPVTAKIENLIGIPGFSVGINIDYLSLFMLCIISGLGFLATLYSVSYMQDYKNQSLYYFLLLMFIGAMNGSVISGDFIIFFLFWELMTASSFILVVFNGTEESKKAGIKYFIMTSVGSLAMLLGITLLYRVTGTLEMSALMQMGLNIGVPSLCAAAIFFMFGLGVKAGIVPLHTWLPDAHPAAPSPVSSLLSGVMIKIGIYMMIRVFLNIFHITIAWNMVICILGVVTILVGVMFALVQHDAKRLLAFHSISQIGYMVLGIGIATTLGVTGALFHLINHACFKGLLFLCMGSIIYRTGERDLQKLGGLAKTMPVTFIACVIAALSISGVPPFNGFASKWIIYQALIEKGEPIYLIFLVGAMLGSALTLASFVKMIHSTFLGQRPKRLKETKKITWSMGLPMVVLAALCVLFGIFPYYPINNYIAPILNHPIVLPGLWSSLSAAGFIVIGIILGLIIYFIGRVRKTARQSTAYVGGEILDNEVMNVSGVQFYTTIKEIQPLKYIYEKHDEEKLDLYPAGMKAAESMARFVYNYVEQPVSRFFTTITGLFSSKNK